jgi:hypothetical protein
MGCCVTHFCESLNDLDLVVPMWNFLGVNFTSVIELLDYGLTKLVIIRLQVGSLKGMF